MEPDRTGTPLTDEEKSLRPLLKAKLSLPPEEEGGSVYGCYQGMLRQRKRDGDFSMVTTSHLENSDGDDVTPVP